MVHMWIKGHEACKLETEPQEHPRPAQLVCREEVILESSKRLKINLFNLVPIFFINKAPALCQMSSLHHIILIIFSLSSQSSMSSQTWLKPGTDPTPPADETTSEEKQTPKATSPKELFSEIWRNICRHFEKKTHTESALESSYYDTEQVVENNVNVVSIATLLSPSAPLCARLSPCELRHREWNHLAQFEIGISSRITSFP